MSEENHHTRPDSDPAPKPPVSDARLLCPPESSSITFYRGDEPVLVLDREGFIYKGERVPDAGEAHRIFREVMNEYPAIIAAKDREIAEHVAFARAVIEALGPDCLRSPEPKSLRQWTVEAIAERDTLRIQLAEQKCATDFANLAEERSRERAEKAERQLAEQGAALAAAQELLRAAPPNRPAGARS